MCILMPGVKGTLTVNNYVNEHIYFSPGITASAMTTPIFSTEDPIATTFSPPKGIQNDCKTMIVVDNNNL